jgi:hypothetical protein
MGYIEDDSMVRVDFFKHSGKWYTTEAIKWDRYLSRNPNTEELELIHETFRRCLDEQLGERLREMIAVCLEPQHENAHPLMIDRSKANGLRCS